MPTDPLLTVAEMVALAPDLFRQSADTPDASFSKEHALALDIQAGNTSAA